MTALLHLLEMRDEWKNDTEKFLAMLCKYDLFSRKIRENKIYPKNIQFHEFFPSTNTLHLTNFSMNKHANSQFGKVNKTFFSFYWFFFSLFQKSNVIIHRRLKMASLKLLTSRTTISTARRPPIIVIQALYFGVCHFHVKKSMMNHMSSLFAWKKKLVKEGEWKDFGLFVHHFSSNLSKIDFL